MRGNIVELLGASGTQTRAAADGTVIKSHRVTISDGFGREPHARATMVVAQNVSRAAEPNPGRFALVANVANFVLDEFKRTDHTIAVVLFVLGEELLAKLLLGTLYHLPTELDWSTILVIFGFVGLEQMLRNDAEFHLVGSHLAPLPRSAGRCRARSTAGAAQIRSDHSASLLLLSYDLHGAASTMSTAVECWQ